MEKGINKEAVDTHATAEHIRKLAFEKRISPIEMTGKIGCSMQDLYAFLDGTTLPRDTLLENMAAVFNIPLEKMLIYRQERSNHAAF